VSIDTLKIEKKEPPIKAKHHYRYFTDISGKEEKVAGIISYLPEQYIFGGIDYEDFNPRYNDYSSRTIELPNGNIFKVDGYYRKVFANIENQRIYTYGYSFKYDGKPNHEKYNLSFIDFEGNVLNSYGNKYEIQDAEFAKDGSLIADCIVKIDSVTTEHALCYFDKNGNLKWTHKKSSGKYLVTLTLSNTEKYIAFVEHSWTGNYNKGGKKIIYVLDQNGNIVYENDYKSYMGASIGMFSSDDRYLYYVADGYKRLYSFEEKKYIFKSGAIGFYKFKIDEESNLIFFIGGVSYGKYSLNVLDIKTNELLTKIVIPGKDIKKLPEIELIDSNTIQVSISNYLINYKLNKNEK